MTSFLLGAMNHQLHQQPHGGFHFPLPSVRDVQSEVPWVLADEWWDQDPNLALSASMFHFLAHTVITPMPAGSRGLAFHRQNSPVAITLLFYLKFFLIGE